MSSSQIFTIFAPPLYAVWVDYTLPAEGVKWLAILFWWAYIRPMNHNERLAAEAKKRRKQMLALLNKGETVTTLAAYYDISKQRVSQLLKLARAE